MDRIFKNTGRITSSFPRVRAIALIIAHYLIPTLLIGCSPFTDPTFTPKGEQTDFSVTLKSGEGDEIIYSDIFVFNDDAPGKLDSYQRCEGGAYTYIGARKGEKTVVVIANSPKEREYWRKIRSYEGLQQEMALLIEEDSAHPLMSGTAHIDFGRQTDCEIHLRKLMSEIYVNSICTDFRGCEYEGSPLSDVRIYLTNVNASCTILREQGFKPQTLISPKDFAGHDDLICRKLEGDIGEEPTFPEISLYCYPSDSWDDTAGSPHTRLVIEGKIGGHIYYYPLDINHVNEGVSFGDGSEGIRRNCKYIFDICICRTGTSSADIALRKNEALVSCRIEDWTELDDYVIEF